VENRKRCPEKQKLQKDLNAAILNLSAEMVPLSASVGNHAEFQQAKRRCEILKGEILELKQKIAAHQKEHGC
jgi:hypothetical protein